MMEIKPIEPCDADALDDTSYATMTRDQRLEMIDESQNKLRNGRYREFFKVIVDGTIVGFMNVYAHSAHIISCGPEIKEPYRRRGYAYEAEKSVLAMAKDKGYTVAVGGVQDTNTASRALHEKLGFEMDRIYTNKGGRNICVYIRAL